MYHPRNKRQFAVILHRGQIVRHAPLVGIFHPTSYRRSFLALYQDQCQPYLLSGPIQSYIFITAKYDTRTRN